MKTPVSIINQRYLVGQLNGVVYLEVHASAEDTNMNELKKIFDILKNMEKKTKRTIDWDRVDKTLAEARGVPVPILEINDGIDQGAERIIEVSHPGKLYGRPEIPELSMKAWYVLAADLHDEIEAVRKRRRRSIWKYVEEPMTKPTKIAL